MGDACTVLDQEARQAERLGGDVPRPCARGGRVGSAGRGDGIHRRCRRRHPVRADNIGSGRTLFLRKHRWAELSVACSWHNFLCHGGSTNARSSPRLGVFSRWQHTDMHLSPPVEPPDFEARLSASVHCSATSYRGTVTRALLSAARQRSAQGAAAVLHARRPLGDVVRRDARGAPLAAAERMQ